MIQEFTGRVVEELRRASAVRPAAAPAQVSAATLSGYEGPLLLGHRGARPTRRLGRPSNGVVPPENTLPCLEYALSHGVDGFEFDVRLTSDDRLVLCHDARIGGRNVSKSTHASLCSRQNRFPCLEEALTAFAARAYLNIEVKVGGAEEAIARALRECPPKRGFLVSSFLPDVLVRLHQNDSSLPLGYVCDHAANLPLWRELPIQVVLPHYKLMTKELVDDVHRHGLQVFTWTVNREADMLQLCEWGIDGVISDDPGLLCRTLRPLDSSGKKAKSAAHPS